ncbi:MAG: helix-turn-helix transcriptional regulator [Hyphomonadaceae bacterium]|nr:helix-turn-helix transcriptional regulator [Hyphomonadaceae bacterium]
MDPGSSTSVPDLARHAFDSATRIAAAQTFADLEAATRSAVTPLGVTDFMVVRSVNGQASIIAGSPTNPYFRAVQPESITAADPVHRYAHRTTDAFFYSDLPTLIDMSAADCLAMATRASFGIIDGFVGVRHRQDGVHTCVTMIGDRMDARTPDAREAFYHLAEAYGRAARRLLTETHAAPVVLTRRQLDCLYWVGRGKSSADIAAILGLSTHTVHAHVSDACARLGVRTRVQAVAAAVARGLISP